MESNDARKWVGSDRSGPQQYQTRRHVDFDTPWNRTSYPRMPPYYQHIHPRGALDYPRHPYNYYQGYGKGDWYQNPVYPDPNVLPQYRSSRQAWNTHPQVACPQIYGGDWYQSPRHPDPSVQRQYHGSQQAWNIHPQVVCPQSYGGGDWYQSPVYSDPSVQRQYHGSRQAWNAHPQVVCPQSYGGGDWYQSPVYSDPSVQRQYHSSRQARNSHPRAEYHRSDQVNLGGEELSSSTRPVVRRLFVHKPDAVHVNRTVHSTGPTQGLANLPRGVPPSKGSTQISFLDLSVKGVAESSKDPVPRKRQRPKSISPGTQPEPKRPELRVPSVPTPPAPSRSDSPTQPRQFTLTASLSTVSIPSISRTDLDLEYLDDGACDILGEGGYGYVQRGRLEQDEMATNIAAKFFKPNRASVEEIEREAKIQRYLQDTGAVPKVHGLINMASKGGDPILVQECVGQGTTVEDLMARGADRKAWLQFTLQAAQGLQKIHQKGVLLNDIKFDNILVDESQESFKVKFVDMGMATFNSSYTSTVNPADMVDCHHIAPEVVNQAPSSVKSDLYSLGYVLRVVGKDAHLPDLEMLGSLLMCDNPALRLSLPVFVKCVEFFMNSCN